MKKSKTSKTPAHEDIDSSQQAALFVQRAVNAKIKGRWVKVIVTYGNVYHLSAALPLAMHLASDGSTVLYFARYTHPPYRVEIQMLTNRTLEDLRRTVMKFKYRNFSALGIRFEECNGSVAHALAFNIVGVLKLTNQLSMKHIQDITHWMYNMAGFSYLQEARASAISALMALNGVPGVTDDPVFGPKLVPQGKAPDVKQDKAPAVKKPSPRKRRK